MAILDIDSSILPSSIAHDDSSYNNCVDNENDSHENTKQHRLHLSTTNLLTNTDDTPPTSDEDDVSYDDEESDVEPDEEEGNLLLQELGVDNYLDEESLEYSEKTNDCVTLHQHSNYNSDSEEESVCSTSSSDEQDELLEESEEEEEEEKPFTEDELQDYLENMCDSRENYEVQPSLTAVEQPQQLDEESDIDDIEEEEIDIDDDEEEDDEYYTDRSSQETESVTSTTIGTPLKLSQVSSTSATNNNNYDDKPDHELFLPLFCSPHTERLNIPDEEDGLSDDESDYFYSGQSRTVYRSGARTGGYGNSNNPYLHRTYMNGNRVVAPTRPRMWDGYGCNHYQQQVEEQNSPTVSDSSEEDNLSQASIDSSSSNKDGNAEAVNGGKQSVSFDTSVTVYPIYETSQYSSDMIQQMYTNREELRINKLRNKREYAHDSFNWRDVTEEDGMIVDDTSGELVHPVHTVADVGKKNKKLGSNIKVTGPGPSIRNVVRQTYSSALGGYTSMTMGGGGHRTKRMRMCW